MKNALSFINKKSENRSFDALNAFALNNESMEMVLGGGDGTYPPGGDPILYLWEDEDEDE